MGRGDSAVWGGGLSCGQESELVYLRAELGGERGVSGVEGIEIGELGFAVSLEGVADLVPASVGAVELVFVADQPGELGGVEALPQLAAFTEHGLRFGREGHATEGKALLKEGFTSPRPPAGMTLPRCSLSAEPTEQEVAAILGIFERAGCAWK